jgi:hypothetical protein
MVRLRRITILVSVMLVVLLLPLVACAEEAIDEVPIKEAILGDLGLWGLIGSIIAAVVAVVAGYKRYSWLKVIAEGVDVVFPIVEAVGEKFGVKGLDKAKAAQAGFKEYWTERMGEGPSKAELQRFQQMNEQRVLSAKLVEENWVKEAVANAVGATDPAAAVGNSSEPSV